MILFIVDLQEMELFFTEFFFPKETQSSQPLLSDQRDVFPNCLIPSHIKLHVKEVLSIYSSFDF